MSYHSYNSTRRHSLRWHDLLPLRDAIDRKTSCVDADYDLIFGDASVTTGHRECRTGYTDFERRQCWINAEVLPNATPSEQFASSVFLAAHERAHAKWTDFVEADFNLLNDKGEVVKDRNGKPAPDLMLHQTWNILEDERIERLLGRDFPHLHRYLKSGNGLLLSLVDPVKGTDDPMEVMLWVLRRRLSTRADKPEACPLSSANQALLAQCEPLIQEAFGCTSSRRVVELARKINKILKLSGSSGSPVLRLLSGQSGARKEGDAAEQDSASEEEGQLYNSSSGSPTGNEDIEALFQSIGYSADVRRGGNISAAPYASLLNEVRPFVGPLRHLFQTPPSKRMSVFEETGARLSIRAAKRTPKTPFRVDTPPTKRGNVALTLVIDDSGSMMGHREHQAKLTSLLCYEALEGPHKVRAVLSPSGRVAADRSLKEMSRGYIAGYDSNSGTEYATVLKAELQKLEQLGKGYTRYLVLVADGDTGQSDLSACAKLVERARKKGIHTFGIGIELSPHTVKSYETIFGRAFIDLQSASQLPARMQALLRRIAHNKAHRGVA